MSSGKRLITLAGELGVDSRTVMDVCHSMGLEPGGISTVIADEDCARITKAVREEQHRQQQLWHAQEEARKRREHEERERLERRRQEAMAELVKLDLGDCPPNDLLTVARHYAERDYGTSAQPLVDELISQAQTTAYEQNPELVPVAVLVDLILRGTKRATNQLVNRGHDALPAIRLLIRVLRDPSEIETEEKDYAEENRPYQDDEPDTWCPRMIAAAALGRLGVALKRLEKSRPIANGLRTIVRALRVAEGDDLNDQLCNIATTALFDIENA